jgi:methyl-accepting chemotaxis protein
MWHKINSFGLRQKFVGGVSLLLMAIALFIFLFFPSRQEDQMHEYLGDKGAGLAVAVANSASAGMLFDDASSVKSALEGISNVPGVSFALALKPDGTKLAALRDENSAGKLSALQGRGPIDSLVTLDETTHLLAAVPVKSGGTRLGTVVVGLDQSKLRADATEARWMALGAGAFILCLGFITIFWLTNEVVVKPVVRVAGGMDNADLNLRFNSHSADEIGTLTRAFDHFVNSIRETLVEVSQASAAVASASAEISSSTEEMAAGTQEQTTQAGEVASAVEEMARTIMTNSANSASAVQTARTAREAAEQGGTIVDETVRGMKRIAEVVRSSAGTVQALGASSDQIGEIVSVINDIADQTNLLALNAAIEAARAGDQGRGFAVVADEVRKLAERTTKATKEIAGMIRQIQGDTAGAVTSMDLGTREVESGLALADRAGESLRRIVSISEQVTNTVTQIASASDEQARAAEQIAKNVEAIRTVSSETAEGTHQIARSAEDLNRLTENLQHLLGRFSLSTADQRKQEQPVPLHVARPETSHLAVRSNGKIVQAG